MANIFGISREWLFLAFPLAGYYVGKYFDDLEKERSAMFRDKSMLFKGVRREGDPPSW
jgi:hypothetical protein